MAEKLTDYEFHGAGSRSKYAQYLDGAIWKLALDDFPGLSSLDHVRSAIYGRARTKGLRLRTAMDDGYLVVQAFRPEESNGAS